MATAGTPERQVTSGLDEAVRTGVEEVRYRNGLTLAGLRLGLRTLTLALWLFSLFRIPVAERASHLPAVATNVAHLALGVWILLMLQRRRHVLRVLGVAAAADVLVVAFAGWNSDHGDGASYGFLMGVMLLMLLFSTLTLPRRHATVLGALVTAWQLALGLRMGLRFDVWGAAVITTGIFAVAATWIGSRMVELAARHALDGYTAELVRAHRDELAQANLEIAAQRDRVLAAQAEAETLSKLVVHDLRNPIAALQQFVALALDRLRQARQRGLAAPELTEAGEDLQFAVEEGQRLEEMVGDLLLIARLETVALQPRRLDTPVRALLEQVAYGAALRAEDRLVAVAVTAPSDLLAPIDRDLLRRLLENLVSNALRFVDRGGRLELAAGLEGGQLVLAVRNTGPAVPEEVRPHLFQKHGHGADRQLYNVGLGLYLCRLVAEAHGGSMALAEAPGWAAAFEARLPMSRGG
jgi:signal transduction histidine kinase